jgi:peptidoglycan/LPS O-acetylase OafA/YrhL
VIIPLLIGAFISFFYNTSFLSKNLLLSTLLVTTASFFLFNIFRTIHIENNKTVSFVTILSYSSYSMYLFHRPIYITLKKVYFPSLYFLQVLYLFIVGFFCIFVFSFFIQKTYDILVRQINR